MIREYGYEYEALPEDALWQKTEGKTTAEERLFGAYCLRSGRDALKAIAREYEPCTALLPALCCDSMIHPFALYGHKVRFYRLNRDYSIDPDSIKTEDGRTLFLYMDYFGKESITDQELEWLRAKGNVIFIEDRTQNLIQERRRRFQPDYMMASLRKWIPIPDGGLLWGKISRPLASDTAFSAARLKAQRLRYQFLQCGDERIKTEFRRIFSTVSEMMEDDAPSGMSLYAYELAKRTDWEKVRSSRKANAEALISTIAESPDIHLIQNQSGKSDLYTAFTVNHRDEVQRRLSAEGIFNTIIWPLSKAQKTACETAGYTAEHMLAAPCDQRYSAEDMHFVGSEIVRTIADVNR